MTGINNIPIEVITDDITKQNRLNICNSCDKKYFDLYDKCSECLCVIEMLVGYNFKSCPIGKW